MNNQAYIIASLKAEELKAYRQYIFSLIDMINAQIDVRVKLNQWHIIEYMKAQRDMLADQEEEIYNELTALETQILSYLEEV